MYLIFKREDPYGIVAFHSLNDIENAVKKEIYGEYNYDEKTETLLKNNYTDFTIIKNPEFPYTICDNYYKDIGNIILDVSEQKQYYLLDEHHYAHGVWDWPTMDGKKLIFNDLIEMKKYCEDIVDKTPYLDGCEDSDYLSDLEQIDIKFNVLEDYKNLNDNKLQKEIPCSIDDQDNIHFTIGNDFYVDFTISKIKSSDIEHNAIIIPIEV